MLSRQDAKLAKKDFYLFLRKPWRLCASHRASDSLAQNAAKNFKYIWIVFTLDLEEKISQACFSPTSLGENKKLPQFRRRVALSGRASGREREGAPHFIHAAIHLIPSQLGFEDLANARVLVFVLDLVAARLDAFRCAEVLF